MGMSALGSARTVTACCGLGFCRALLLLLLLDLLLSAAG
jgi:hypothetical protein